MTLDSVIIATEICVVLRTTFTYTNLFKSNDIGVPQRPMVDNFSLYIFIYLSCQTKTKQKYNDFRTFASCHQSKSGWVQWYIANKVINLKKLYHKGHNSQEAFRFTKVASGLNILADEMVFCCVYIFRHNWISALSPNIYAGQNYQKNKPHQSISVFSNSYAFCKKPAEGISIQSARTRTLTHWFGKHLNKTKAGHQLLQTHLKTSILKWCKK